MEGAAGAAEGGEAVASPPATATAFKWRSGSWGKDSVIAGEVVRPLPAPHAVVEALYTTADHISEAQQAINRRHTGRES